MTRGGQTYFYHLNAGRDVVAISDESGAIVNTYSYDPWGTSLSAHEAVPDPCRCASYRYDTATGLYYCWNRCYAPELARFLTRDIYPGELSDPVTLNPYLYCGADPVNAVDPSGMMSDHSAVSLSLSVLGITFATVAAIALVAASAGTLTPLAAAAIGAGMSALGAGTSVAGLAITEGQYSRGEIDRAQYELQTGLGYWGLGSSLASGVLCAVGPAIPEAVGAYAAVHGCNVSGTSLMIGIAQAATEAKDGR